MVLHDSINEMYMFEQSSYNHPFLLFVSSFPFHKYGRQNKTKISIHPALSRRTRSLHRFFPSPSIVHSTSSIQSFVFPHNHTSHPLCATPHPHLVFSNNYLLLTRHKTSPLQNKNTHHRLPIIRSSSQHPTQAIRPHTFFPLKPEVFIHKVRY
jgi:hypothetical protein